MFEKVKEFLKKYFEIKQPAKLTIEMGKHLWIGYMYGKQKANLIRATEFKRPYTFYSTSLVFPNFKTEFKEMKEWFD